MAYSLLLRSSTPLVSGSRDSFPLDSASRASDSLKPFFSVGIRSSVFGYALYPVQPISSRDLSRRNFQPIRAMATEASPIIPSCKHAVISLSDKRNLCFLAEGLHRMGYSIISTGETAKQIEEQVGISVTRVKYIGSIIRMLDGNKKHLNVEIYNEDIDTFSRLDREDDFEVLKKLGTFTLSLVVANLYPHEKVFTLEGGYGNIDVEARFLIRTVAKKCLVVVDHRDYAALLDILLKTPVGPLSQNFHEQMKEKAMAHLDSYEDAVEKWECANQEMLREIMFAGRRFLPDKKE